MDKTEILEENKELDFYIQTRRKRALQKETKGEKTFKKKKIPHTGDKESLDRCG